MERTLEAAGKGVGRWCADDVGAVVWGKPGLRELARIFKNSDKLAGLALKPPKCCASPLWAPWSDDLIAPTSERLAS
eukprot:3290507-Pyramimonas_sp.AAC.1